jgi:HK97 gp10 family phage protein
VTVKHEKVQLKRDPAVSRELLEDGWKVAQGAAAMAPTDSTLGAQSIRAELAKDENGDPEVRVSWDRDHFYMSFSEFGTESQSPRPFLRPAADRFR